MCNIHIPAVVTKTELANAYQIPYKSFRSWLRTAKIDFKGSLYLPPKVVEQIIDEFGMPKKWKEENF